MIWGLILGLLLPLLLGMAFLLGRHLQRRPESGRRLSAVSRQHLEVWQGGPVDEDAVEAAKNRFRELLDRGEVARVEASLRPGPLYIFQVRALAEIGTESACKILERQLHRRLSDDLMEQSWYRIDLANSLRTINRQESLPHLLRCVDGLAENPLGHFFAAETVCFLGFAGYLKHSQTTLGRAAMRLLHRVLEGFRFGLPPQIVVEARLGEAIDHLWDHRPEQVSPWMVRILHESLRFLRRVPHLEKQLTHERNEHESFAWQISHLQALEGLFQDFLKDVGPILREQLTTTRDLPTLLQTMNDLHLDTGKDLLALIPEMKDSVRPLAVEVLTWSRDPHMGSWLRKWCWAEVPMLRRRQWRRCSHPPRKSLLPEGFPYVAALKALRGHPSMETENFLLLAAEDWDPTIRSAAFSSLGWWEPLQRRKVLQMLEMGRVDSNHEVRQSARAALARLGERHALHWFRQALVAEMQDQVHEAMRLIASEGLTLLWPDLDRLADSENAEVAYHAWEALEQMNEEMFQGR